MWIVNPFYAFFHSAWLSTFIQYETKCGTYFGKELNINGNKSVVEFLGIQYAHPPTGEYRFRKPHLSQCLKGQKIMANQPAKACPQFGLSKYRKKLDDLKISKHDMSEDCLQLNIWGYKKNNDENSKGFPVLVFFHDGHFLEGSASLNEYNGSILALKTKSIVVTVNYRLGVLGFAQSYLGLYIPGNLGLMDQQIALQWINKNIHDFGGDPNKVTILGIGAGAASVSAHLLARDSFRYYDKAIMFSGHMGSPVYSKQPKEIQKYTEEFMKIMGCRSERHPEKDLSCLRRKSVDQILKVSEDIYKKFVGNEFGSPFSISTQDNVFFKRKLQNKYIDLHNQNNFNFKASILLGHAGNEGALELLNVKYPYIIPYDSSKGEYVYIVSTDNYNKILNGLYKKLKIPLDKRQNFNDTYANYSRDEEKVMRIFSDIKTDCSLKLLTYSMLITNKTSPHVLMINKTSGSNSYTKYQYPWLGATQREVVENIFGHPFLYLPRYTMDRRFIERNYSEKVMNVIGDFIYGKPFNKTWLTSNLTVFRERFTNDAYTFDNYKILNSTLLSNSCSLLW